MRTTPADRVTEPDAAIAAPKGGSETSRGRLFAGWHLFSLKGDDQ